MTDQPASPGPDPSTPELGTAVPQPPAPEPASWAPPNAEPASDGGAESAAADRPEIAVGGAFAGGFLLAMILKRLAR